MDLEKRKEEVRKLVQAYEKRKDEYRKEDYNEAQLRNDFLNPFFKALGWDVDNEKGKPRHLREVKIESSVKEDESVKKPDYEFRNGKGSRKFFVEAKKPSISLDNSDPALQTRRYGWNAGLPIALLSNFEKLVFYDCTEVPKDGDRPHVGRIKTYDYQDYVEKFEEIYEQISREAVFTGNFDERFVEPREEREVETFDDVFLEQLEEWREKLARNIIENNPEITQEELNYFVHRLLNRIIFLRICEDRNHEPYEKLKNIDDISYEKLYEIFRNADEKYNSRLFKLIDEYSSDNLDIDPEVLASVLKQLYYPDSPYTFAVVESHIIGKIYDLFLGRSLTIHQGELKVEKKPEVKHSQGKVTTPKFIVNEYC